MIGGDYEASIETLEAALAAVINASTIGMSAADYTARSCRIQRISNQIDAFRVTTLSDTQRAVASETPGVRSTTVIAGRATCDPATVREDQRLGLWLEDFPVLAAAHLAGDLCRNHIKVLRRIDNPRNHYQMQEAQQFFVESATGFDFKDFEQIVRYWLNASDPDGELPKEQLRRSGLSFRTNADGSVSGKFYFDPLTGAAFTTAVEAEAQRLFREEAAADAMTSHYRRAGEALTALVILGAARPNGTYPTPLINVVLGEQLAEDILNGLADTNMPSPVPDFAEVGQRCELIDGTPLHPHFAGIALAAGEFQRIVMDARDRPINVASKSRGFPPWMRQLLLVRARGRCQTRGCDAPLSWLQADHVKPHSKQGQTSLENGQILCDHDNKLKRDTH